MAFAVKYIEWRSVNNGAWHLFLGNKSICRRMISNGEFEFADKPPIKNKVCKFCLRDKETFKKRVADVTK